MNAIQPLDQPPSTKVRCRALARFLGLPNSCVTTLAEHVEAEGQAKLADHIDRTQSAVSFMKKRDCYVITPEDGECFVVEVRQIGRDSKAR